MDSNTVLGRVCLTVEGDDNYVVSIADIVAMKELYIRSTWHTRETWHKVRTAYFDQPRQNWPAPSLADIKSCLDARYSDLECLMQNAYADALGDLIKPGSAEHYLRYIDARGEIRRELKWCMEQNRELVALIDWIWYQYETLQSPRPYHMPIHAMPNELLPRINDKRAGYVYVIKQVNGDYYKIGRSKTPEKRKRVFDVKLPFDVETEVLIQSNDYIALERDLHRKYKHKRVGGEWFALTDHDLSEIKSIAM